MRELEKMMGIPSDRRKALGIFFTIYTIILAILTWLERGTDGKTLMTVTLIGTMMIMDIELFLFSRSGFGSHTFDELLFYYPADISVFIPHLMRYILAEGTAAYAIAALLLIVLGKTTTNMVYILIMNLRALVILLAAWLIALHCIHSDLKKTDLTGCSLMGPVLTMQGIMLVAVLFGGAIF